MQTLLWIVSIALGLYLLGVLAMNVGLWWAKRGSDGRGR